MDFTTPSQQPLQQRRKVTFGNSVAFREIPHLNDLDEQVITSIWYAPQDYQQFKAICKLTVKMMMKHGCQITEEDPELCCRGLVRVKQNQKTQFPGMLTYTVCLVENGRLSKFFSGFPHCPPPKNRKQKRNLVPNVETPLR
jgi:hypothetical protein